MEFKNTKVSVNSEEQSRKVQEKMFKLGFSWDSGRESGKTLQYLDEKYLFFYDNMDICYNSTKGEFDQDSKREVKVSDILEGYKEISPTHLVIWNILSSGDPHRFFTSEKEAKDFMKELSEKSDVVKDSVILVAIKSVQKVSVTKIVRLKNYKI